MAAHTRHAHLALLLYALLISTSFPLASYLGERYPPLLTTLLRFILAAAGFVLLMARARQLQWPGWRALGRYALISLPLTGFFLLMFRAGQSATPLAMGSLATLVPLLSCLLGWLCWRVAPTAQRLLALTLGALGAIWVLTAGDLTQLGADGWPEGNSEFLLACGLMAGYPLTLKQLHRGEPMLTITGWSLITGTGWLLLAAGFDPPPWRWPDGGSLLAILWLALFTTMLTFYLFQAASLVVGGSSAHAYSLLMPALVLMLEAAIGQRVPHWSLLPGLALTLLALAWLLKMDHQPHSERRI
ncbi:DMT family transporter [Ferrimonas gelatinilytica]|uniref:DMT family transporter n=1 Tax=Ferrimonas gelatinilytica TaxID=1255257 RepID=A0ABP9SD36_9GAMM